MSLFDRTCFTCGEPGHYSAACPQRKAKSSGDRNYQVPPEPPRRPVSQVADPEIWAAKIREQLGWEKGQRHYRGLQSLEDLAKQQVESSRTNHPVAEESGEHATVPRDTVEE